MARIEMSEFVERAKAFRDQHPAPITLQALISELHQQLEQRPARTELKNQLRRAMTDAAVWIVDLDAGPPVGDLRSLLTQWVDPGSSKDGLGERIRDALRKEPEGSQHVAVARALEIVPGEVEWTLLQPDSLARELRLELLNRALEAGELAWAIDALCHSSGPVPKAIRERLSDIDGERLTAVLRTRLMEWPAKASGEPSWADAVVRLAALSREADPSIANDVLKGLLSADVSRPTPKWATALLDLAARNAVTLRDALEAAETSQISRLLQLLADTPTSPDSTRAQVVRALLETRHSAALRDSEAWRGWDIDALGAMVMDKEYGEGLMSIAGDSAIGPIVERIGRTLPAWKVLEITGRWPRLARFVSVEHLKTAAQRSDPSAELIRSLLRSATNEARSDLDELEMRLESVTLERSAALEELLAAQKEIVQLRDQIDGFRARLAAHSRQTVSATKAEVNQGRIDLLKALIDLRERLHGMIGLDVKSDRVLAPLLGDIAHELERSGVRIEGHRGEHRPARPDLDDGGLSGPLIEVISPAYLLDSPSEVTLLRRAFVRVVEGGPQ